MSPVPIIIGIAPSRSGCRMRWWIGIVRIASTIGSAIERSWCYGSRGRCVLPLALEILLLDFGSNLLGVFPQCLRCLFSGPIPANTKPQARLGVSREKPPRRIHCHDVGDDRFGNEPLFSLKVRTQIHTALLLYHFTKLNVSKVVVVQEERGAWLETEGVFIGRSGWQTSLVLTLDVCRSSSRVSHDGR